jgi:dipeptidyl-peptidase-4
MTLRRLTPTLPLALVLAACATDGAEAPRPAPDVLVTAAEASGYTRTMTSAEVEAFCRALADRSDRVRLRSLGTTHEGRDIPLLILADPPVEDAAAARRDDRLTVLLLNNIHAGEVSGKEASLMLARELALAEDAPGLLDHLILAIVPNYNPDGNDRMAPDNRPGQVGPDEMGVRPNAQGLDLNRDYVKADAPETRALLRFKNEWDPPLTLDTHTTNGSHHRFTLTYQGPKHPGGDRAILEYVRDSLLPSVDAAFERKTDYLTFFYGNLTRPGTSWVTYPAEPRFGTPYRGLRNRLSILVEAYAYATYRDRVLATLAFLEAALREAADRRTEIRALVEAADRGAARAAERRASIPLRIEVRPFPEPVVVPGYEIHRLEGDQVELGDERDYEVEFLNDFVPALEVELPAGYAIPPGLEPIVELLRLHGVRVDRAAGAGELPVERYTVVGHQRAERAWQGRRRVSNVEVVRHDATVPLAEIAHVVPPGQPLFPLAAYLLEPQSDDGLVAWGFLDDHLDPSAPYPILRVRHGDD